MTKDFWRVILRVADIDADLGFFLAKTYGPGKESYVDSRKLSLARRRAVNYASNLIASGQSFGQMAEKVGSLTDVLNGHYIHRMETMHRGYNPNRIPRSYKGPSLKPSSKKSQK